MQRQKHQQTKYYNRNARDLPTLKILNVDGFQGRLDPNLNRNIGKMSIPHCFDPLVGIKPKHPRVNLLTQAQEFVDEVAPPSQIPGLNLTQFNEIGAFRTYLFNKIPKRSNRACRAKNLLN